MSLSTQPVSPKATPLRPLPKEDPLTPAQWTTLLAITDACIPAIKPMSTADTRTEFAATDTEYSTALSTVRGLTPESDPDATTAAREYLEDFASSNPAFKDELYRILATNMPVSTLKELLMVLNVLNTRAGSLALTGYFTPISEQPVHIRESIIRGWKTARLGVIRGLHRSLTVLARQTWIKITPTLRRVLGVPRVPTGMKPGKGYEYEFIQMPPGPKPEVIETDVVIIGSGCGGAVCAKNLAEAGNRVLVVEKSYHWTPDHYPMSEASGWDHLFMQGGLLTSDDNSTSIVAGQVWGGGGTINWSASLQTQGYVRREWAGRDLPFFTSQDFQDSLDRVCERMGVSTEYLEHNAANAMLLEGARKLGYSHKAVPQNTGGNQHRCGHCTFGCGSCEKQGPVISFLPDAARAGANFIEGLHVERIVFKTIQGKKTATGIIGSWTSRDINGGVVGDPTTRRKVIIKAKRVIVSGGTMQSPLLLMRSGLKNPQIGRNLHVHPVSLLGAIHPQAIYPWDGAILTSVVSEFENLDGHGHGAKLEATNMIPSSWLIWLDWHSGLQYKIDAARMKHMVGYISIAKDRDTGRVYPDPTDGRVRFSYSPSKFDKKHIMTGILALARIQYVAGASEIFTTIPGVSMFKRDVSLPASGEGINDPEFQAWLDEVESMGFPSPESTFVSAHQMGTCRMSALEKEGVVDPTGRVWGVEGLYVADASVFPSASGVNPMVTNMAISDWISRGVAEGLKAVPRL